MKKFAIGGALGVGVAALVYLMKRLYGTCTDIPEFGKHDIGVHCDGELDEFEIEDPGLDEFYIHVYRSACD